MYIGTGDIFVRHTQSAAFVVAPTHADLVLLEAQKTVSDATTKWVGSVVSDIVVYSGFSVL